MPRTTRTFVGLEIPGDRREKLARLQGLLAPEVEGARWVEPASLHATLAFLGDVDDTELDPVCRAVAGAAAGFGPLGLRLEGLGCFPSPERPRTLWVGVAGPGVEALGALQGAITRAIAIAGYPVDDDRFHPHVTLGRLKPGRGPVRDLGPLVRHYKGWAAGDWPVSEVVTYASTLTPDGPVYVPLARAPLAGAAG